VRRADNITTFLCRLSWSLGASASWNSQGLSRLVLGMFYFHSCKPIAKTCLFCNKEILRIHVPYPTFCFLYDVFPCAQKQVLESDVVPMCFINPLSLLYLFYSFCGPVFLPHDGWNRQPKHVVKLNRKSIQDICGCGVRKEK